MRGAFCPKRDACGAHERRTCRFSGFDAFAAVNARIEVTAKGPRYHEPRPRQVRWGAVDRDAGVATPTDPALAGRSSDTGDADVGPAMKITPARADHRPALR